MSTDSLATMGDGFSVNSSGSGSVQEMGEVGSSILWFAHSANSSGRHHPLREHLRAVSSLAAEFSKGLPWAKEAELSGFLHDLGKYGDLFQARLKGKLKGIDHWSAGAWVALLREYRSVAAALVVWGHHLGLQRLGKDELGALEPTRLVKSHPAGLRLSEADIETLLRCLRNDGIQVASPSSPFLPGIPCENHIAWMIDLRLLFSAVVDADFLDTEAHFEGDETGKRYRPAGPPLEPGRALCVLERYLCGIRGRSKADQRVAKMREDLWQACVSAAERPVGLYTLSAPTGSGKTIAMLAFALAHAKRHGLRRIVVVIPYLTIIEQTVAVYRDAFQKDFGEGFVLEDHSLARGPDGTEDDQSERYWESLFAENWDAPIVVTTSVQFLESLFSNRPSTCRKLHRLVGSVILFDEVQTLPLPLVLPTLAALSHFSSRCRSTIVFATATQPAFDHLDCEVRRWVATGWRPSEIAAVDVGLFRRFRRVEVQWPDLGVPISWDSLCRELSNHDQVLVILNLKRHASNLARRLFDGWKGALFHLSTAMCPAHRQAVLAAVRRRLESRERCLLVSTQCVEAGVDVDFPTVYRALGPLEAIAQAAGRCNREGRWRSGKVVVFIPQEDDEDKKYSAFPDDSYECAASVVRGLLVERGADAMDIEDPALYRCYYERLYKLVDVKGLKRELKKAIEAFDFPKVALEYRLIREDAINVLVPYSERIDDYDALVAEGRADGISGGWMRRAQPLVVSVRRPRKDKDDVVFQYLAPLSLKRGGQSGEWFVCFRREAYDPLTGFSPPQAPPVWLI